MKKTFLALIAIAGLAVLHHATAQVLTPTSTDRTSLTTSDGTWTFSSSTGPSGNVILLNGSSNNGGQAVLLLVTSDTIYAKSNDGRWWVYSNVSAWTPSAGPLGDAAITCTAPTTNTDGSAIAGAQLPLQIYFYEGVAHGPMYRTLSPPQPGCSYVFTGLEPGVHYFAAVAVDALGSSSGGSNEATKTINAAVPNAPSDLTAPFQVQQLDVAYQIVQAPNRITLLAFGHVPAGTPCDAAQSVQDAAHGTLYLVPWDAVTLPNGSANTQKQTVFAPCG